MRAFRFSLVFFFLAPAIAWAQGTETPAELIVQTAALDAQGRIFVQPVSGAARVQLQSLDHRTVTVEATGFSVRVNGSQVWVEALSPVKVRFSPPPPGVIAAGGLPNFNSESFEGVFEANGRGSFRVRPTAARD